MQKRCDFLRRPFILAVLLLALLGPGWIAAQTQPQHATPAAGSAQMTADQAADYAERDRLRADIVSLIGVVAVFAIGVFVLRMGLENRRWNRALQFQTDVRSKLLDKFSASQELLAFMSTDAGRRFLESNPAASGRELESQTNIPFNRVLFPLQLGVVLTMVGAGLLYVRDGIQSGWQTPIMVYGTVILMLGIGFIISAVTAYWLARRLDLLPPKVKFEPAEIPKERL